MAHMFSRFTGNSTQSFSVVRAIQAHLDQRARIEDYVSGRSTEKPDVSAGCKADCPLGKWLHSEGGKICTDAVLLDTLRKSCEEFHEAASQAVLLRSMGKAEMAGDAERMFCDSSEQYQTSLANLSVTCQLHS